MQSRTEQIEELFQREDFSILYHTRTLDSTIQWLINNGLVHSSPRCPTCQNSQMSYIKDPSKADKIKLRC